MYILNSYYYLTVVVFGLRPISLFSPCYTRCYTPPPAVALYLPSADDGTYLCYTHFAVCPVIILLDRSYMHILDYSVPFVRRRLPAHNRDSLNFSDTFLTFSSFLDSSYYLFLVTLLLSIYCRFSAEAKAYFLVDFSSSIVARCLTLVGRFVLCDQYFLLIQQA